MIEKNTIKNIYLDYYRLIKITRFILLFFLLFTNVHSQHICATDKYNKPFQDSNPEKYEQIEIDIQNYLNAPKQKSGHHIIIPVVFHIVYNDANENIPDSVIYQQLEVLNESFNARNPDTTILTDTLKNWIGNFKISFELAYEDPYGLPTGGITRTHTQMSAFSYYGNLVKFGQHGKDAWPTDRYLNIWVCDLYNYLLGYAQFPGGPEETDGVVLDWQTVGNQQYPWTYDDPAFSAWIGGKVAVHEIGHWLNLYHPWGNDGQCSEDYIPETGSQGGPIYPSAECPDTLFSTCNPIARVFVKHYMDYGGNNCLVCFTKNQVLRGLASLETYRAEMIDNYQPRPTINRFKETKINPTHTQGRVYIELPPFSGNIIISAYDISGKMLYRTITTKRFNELFLDVSAGVYIINIEYNNQLIFSSKIMVTPNSPYGASIFSRNEIEDFIFLIGLCICLCYYICLKNINTNLM